MEEIKEILKDILVGGFSIIMTIVIIVAVTLLVINKII
jgi:hypothetical protein